MKKEEMQMRNTRRQKSGKNNKKKVTRSSVKLSFMYFCTHHRLVKADIGNFNISSV